MFNHLHVHTEYSALDGLCKIEELILRAKSIGQTAIAITDHGVSSGLYEAYNLGIKHNFNVILGEEFYFINEDNKNGHIILLAKNQEGLKNIYRLQAKAIENFYYKPRITLELLKEHNEGLICTTACIANQVGQYILQDKIEKATLHLIDLRGIFGDDFYVELQSSTSDDVIKVNKKLIELADELGIKTIITNDVHYVEKDDYKAHEVMLCIQQVAKMDSPKRWKFENNDYWLKTEEEIFEYMPYISDKQRTLILANIANITNKCAGVKIESGDYLPKFFSTKEEEDTTLFKLTMDNYNSRVRNRGECTHEFLTDLYKELNVIEETGYSGYFLTVQEYANWAREQGILVGDGRGSGAGSKVAYTIGITEVNPQKYDLLFERFLSPGREPDFDIDFSDIGAVFRHLQDIYGKDSVARVGAFARLTCKAVLRKILSAFNYTSREITSIVNMLPNRLSFTFEEALNENQELAKWMNSHKDIKYYTEKLEGKISHYSTHAGGVIICKDLTSILPVMPDKDDKNKMVIAYDKHIIENLGHYKFDVLGLKSLNMLQSALQNVKDLNGIDIDWNKIDFEDKNVYDMLSEGNVLGVFQLSEQPEKVSEQKPTCFEDLIAINALIRPGVCDWQEYLNARKKNIKSKLSYMDCTHDLIVYQDQYLQLAQTYAGWDIAYSDKHIRKNKDIRNDKELYNKFQTDCLNNGYSIEQISDVWKSIEDVVAGGYGFNRAHSTSYARLSYQTAWLKKYYPKEFYSAYLTQNFDNFAEINKVNSILKDENIKLINPSVKELNDYFKPTEEGIIFPITSIKGVGGSILYEIKRLQPIKSFDDFLSRRIPKLCKKTAMYALIKSGAFDYCEESRKDMLIKCGYEDTVESNSKMEYETLGIYISENPFTKYKTMPFSDLANQSYVLTVLQINELAVRNDKNGNEMAFIVGVNDKDTIKLIAFSSIWKKYKDLVKENDICFVKGKKDGTSILINEIEKLE